MIVLWGKGTQSEAVAVWRVRKDIGFGFDPDAGRGLDADADAGDDAGYDYDYDYDYGCDYGCDYSYGYSYGYYDGYEESQQRQEQAGTAERARETRRSGDQGQNRPSRPRTTSAK